jgi:hypothetical protein
MKATEGRVSKMEGITSASIHIGNSDVVGVFVYKNSNQLLDINLISTNYTELGK